MLKKYQNIKEIFPLKDWYIFFSDKMRRHEY